MAAGDRKHPHRFAPEAGPRRCKSDLFYGMIPVVGLIATIVLVLSR